MGETTTSGSTFDEVDLLLIEVESCGALETRNLICKCGTHDEWMSKCQFLMVNEVRTMNKTTEKDTGKINEINTLVEKTGRELQALKEEIERSMKEVKEQNDELKA
ncbi:conserved hypothetical protein [Ricinus communis]|uniref:Uncharacterized protein n=1 Tax=Ricinus communis TaxID=3988 RepID=B9S7F2_RICCO|nr:conserved hypothetical protein [Ricinus communis]